MHILEQYALTSSAKIGRPFLLSEYYPVGVDNYICLNASSGMQSKNYDYYQDVVNILLPILKEKGISIVQIGAPNDAKINDCHHTLGCTKRQTSYILENSLLYFGNDTFSLHVASYHGKKIVYTCSIVSPQNCAPYWTKKEDYRVIEPHRNGNKPSYSPNENPKVINQIKPEEIARNVCELLGFPYSFEFKSINFGESYLDRNLDFVPDALISQYPLNVEGMRVRMDYHFDERLLVENLKLKNVSIVTNKEINETILSTFKDKIKQLIYVIEEDNNPDFIKNALRSGINCVLTSYMSQEKINKEKIKYMDYGIIIQQAVSKKENFSFSSTPDLFYKSNKYILGRGKIYPSKAAWENNVPSSSFAPTVNQIIDTPSFWEEVKYFSILSK